MSSETESTLQQALRAQEQAAQLLQQADEQVQKERILEARVKINDLVSGLASFSKDIREGRTFKKYRDIVKIKAELNDLDPTWHQKFMSKENVYGLQLERPLVDFYFDMLDWGFTPELTLLSFFARAARNEHVPENPFSNNKGR